MIFKLLLLFSITAIVMIWWQGSRTRELATQAARRTCDRCEVQFLDHTVALDTWKLRRDRNGHFSIERTYRFEFAPDGMSRVGGQVHTLGLMIQSVMLDPYED